MTVVTTAAELEAAVAAGDLDITVEGTISGMPALTLSPGVSLQGGTLKFGARGLTLTTDNTVSNTRVVCPEHEIAIGNAVDVSTLGTLTLSDVHTDGQVLLLADGALTNGTVVIDRLTVRSADVRGRADRPHGYGVDALQGGFTLWNRQPDPSSELTADLRHISVGRPDRPVRGSGVFVGGHSNTDGRPDGGRITVRTLSTDEIVTGGGIAEGTPDLISGGVFVQAGAVVEEVVNYGPVTTHGPSGIGFVNFGALDNLIVSAPIVTWGQGARGFNLSDGTLTHAQFASVTTHGDGAVGIQITKPMPYLAVNGDIATTGGQGTSLVRGRQVQLKATALSIKPGGDVGTIDVAGSIFATITVSADYGSEIVVTAGS